MDTFMDYMQNMDYVSFMLICAPIVAVVISGILAICTTKNDTMQRNSSKRCHTSSSKPHNCKNDTLDSGTSGNGKNHQHSTSTSEKQRKSRGANKRHVLTNNNTTDQESRTTSGFKFNNWLQSDMYYYERHFISSSAEDKMATCHNAAHRNSISSEAGGSDDLNCSSSNEDLCSTYSVRANSSKKATKQRQKKHQKRNQHHITMDATNISTNVKLMDTDEETIDNVKPNGVKQISTNGALNLRKQCTKAAALKAVLNNRKISKSYIQGLSTLELNSPVRSSLSSASSTTSINSSVSSSASSSPTNSVNSSPTASPTACKRNTDILKKSAKSLISPLRQFTKLNMNEQEMVQQMRRYVIDPNLLRVFGFPVESVHNEGSVDIFKCLPKHLAEEAVTKDNQRHHCHFYGRKKSDVINKSDDFYSSSCGQQWYANSSIDSGHGSDESSPRSTDSDSSEIGEDDAIAPVMAFYTPDGVYQIFSEYCNSIDKQCVRCSKMFQVNEEGEYLSFDSCTYHWGKLSNVYNGKCYTNIYSCCQDEELSEGCSRHPLHVWNGAVVGINGPYTDFVHTQHRETKLHNYTKVYAIDCEMSYTGLGLEVTKVTVVGYDGALVYEYYVRPQAEVIDYNTRFSGVSEKDFLADSNNSIKTFAEVQHDLLNLFDADTILIGHGLDNDLRVLRLVHKTIVDTSVIFSHSTGYPYRRSLKNLTKSFLKRDIQCSNMGHSSYEDSRACLELMLWRVRKDLRHWNYQ
ncbi:putative RNA exonuclease pqe-1 [Calliphora vicina]|uniref:putative RNA exonuclease pqe-1 n=1 Tax=Calliphora vicina TaxID=7373 RepID=UPI00325AACEB